jgi:hypothetical protein
MYGAAAVSEQELAEKAMDYLPAGCVKNASGGAMLYER